MTNKRTKIMVDEGVYKEFREHIKRTKGKVHGELIPSLEEALELYMRINEDPGLKDLIHDQLQGGRGGYHPLSHEDRERNFYLEFDDRFKDYQRVSSGELTTWIMSFTGAHSEKALKKWRGRLRDKGLIEYYDNGLWRIPGNETDSQVYLPGTPEYVYNLLEPGKVVSIKKLENISGLQGTALKNVIKELEKDNKLISTSPGVWEIMEIEGI
jgi:hypothetical protein